MLNQEKLQPHYEHCLPIVRFYWHRVIKGVVQQIEANEKELILDFGCGQQRLKQYLPGYNIIGYDTIKEYSDIVDYKFLRPHTIVCSHVLEHMNMPQLIETINNFRCMEGHKFLITAQPTENWLSKISNLIGRPGCLKSNLSPIDHKLSMREIHGSLSKFYKLKNRTNILALTVISKWVPD